MFAPLDIFFIAWICNFSPCENARLNVNQIIIDREKYLIENIVKQKENQIINQTIKLRDDI